MECLISVRVVKIEQGGSVTDLGFGNRRVTRGGFREGGEGSGVRPGSFGVFRLLYVSFRLLRWYKSDFKFRVFYFGIW